MSTNSPVFQRLAAAWPEARSICTCGHTGDCAVDDENSEHEGLQGHGACTVPGCKCAHFSWRRWTPAFGAALHELKAANDNAAN